MENKNQKENSEGTTIGDSRENFEESLKTVIRKIEERAKKDSNFILIFSEIDEKEHGMGVNATQIFHKVSPSAIVEFLAGTAMRLTEAVARDRKKTDKEQG